ncbi:hypothetical protein [Cellulomonas pakistanensis]|uniref:Uncharacterized protein n=1 Tax=Cellulomonas pakistanensis TaxID=992287 RepID=A0A919PBY5_9CELL|nr:hypothetical protein [Cellulomonas pakistanensis]GIG35432.1 hypothetical protein Cpa01nite_08130 [Cellulomonas pakistanensis]
MTGTGDARVPGAGVPGVGERGAGRRAGLLPLLTAAASLLAVGGALWLGALRTVVHACVTIDGPLALVGVRLSLLQDAADCPTGVALTPAATQGAVLALGLVVPVVALHAALGALGLGLTALLLTCARTARSVLGAVVRALPRPSAARPAPTPRPAPAWRADHPRAAVLARVLHPHRGPPALA